MAEKKIEHAINYYLSLVNTRKKELFEYFLYKGYQCTALNTLEKKERYNAFNAKMYLGMLITLIDDLADNPKCLNPRFC